MEYIILVIGFILLIKGADWFVSGASGMAAWLRVPAVIIGLTIVAMGTSAPEMSGQSNPSRAALLWSFSARHSPGRLRATASSA